MKDKINSLHIGLLALLVVAVVLAGVSYSRQKKAENQVAVMADAINSATSLEELRSMADGFVAYSGAGTKADAARLTSSQGGLRCYVAERGSDTGREWCEMSGDNDWWNPFSWF